LIEIASINNSLKLIHLMNIVQFSVQIKSIINEINEINEILSNEINKQF